MNIKNLGLAATIFFIGLFFGACIKELTGLKVEPQVNIVELGNLVAVVCLAFLIPWLINIRMDNRRVAKDLLISEMVLFCENVVSISYMIEQAIGRVLTNEEFLNINSKFKKARNQLLGIESELKELSDSSTIEKISKIKSETDEYWKVVSGTNGITPINFEVSAGFYWRQSTRCELLSKEARTLKFHINRII